MLLSLVLAVPAFLLLTVGALGPGVEAPPVIAAFAPVAPLAKLVRQGDAVTITGSVASLFSTGYFAGPNRFEKVNRARLTPDGITVSSGFAAIRAQLAGIRDPKHRGTAVPLAVPVIEVASLGPSQNAALGAIDQVVPMSNAPMPMSPTGALAYARETTAPTLIDASIDKFGNVVTANDINCMADAIYFEARGEAYRGQVAVGQVVMNRLAHPIYPKDICKVVFQNAQMHNACQFSFACDGRPETITDQKSWAQANEIAKGVITGTLYLTEVGKATHYHATYVYPDWAPRLKRVARIGHHIFYQFKTA